MADIQYKKGELLFEGDITTTDVGNGSYVGFIQIQTLISIEEIMIISLNGTEYTCERIAVPNDNGAWVYGGFTPQGPVFTDYPFAFLIYESGQYTPALFTENPDTYTVKIYTAIEDTDSTSLFPTDFIIDYLMKSLQNSNWNVLSSLLGDGDWSRLKAYVETTPKNMNRQVLKALLRNGSSSSDAVVGTAVVGRDTVG